ncbi:polysaccharide deacetylase family protein [Alicyclobacillus tolerans]|uniref:polysaccharide deacetylase family protein n=1 Tax=Alicyclobacillus tolerans TaxID=90970 RepID=UPI001F48227C|nr:polysaccharide deacetylase family protein [Alicyclobacillus tolerans]MCF8567987.1 polysaccharide deacetylase family protein [Alicyclobacillus tolerans]
MLHIRFLLGIEIVVLCSILCPVPAHAAQKVLYLTFDDGPSIVYTPRILDILKQEHVKATFFVLGFRSEQFPGLVRRISKEGHEIGNHGYYHEHIVRKSRDWVIEDIQKTDVAIRKAAGVIPVYYRPPGGLIDKQEVSTIRKTGHPIALWTVDSVDWKSYSATTIVHNVMNGIRPGAIVLLHDGVTNSQYTTQALPILIRKCRAQGYTFQVLPAQKRE